VAAKLLAPHRAATLTIGTAVLVTEVAARRTSRPRLAPAMVPWWRDSAC